ncbi:hypothetical protein RQ831_05450 [Roseomonas gilardii]|uniref:Uncharacterized protein n=1 Tax=Roseomonas gilardii TaxID=257708 RepID=A0ABU3MDE0_9PROT|nr:hypothetical protein [Roseomonas gilardii]MDT8330491.1 hypothetical protein [Roseomonas gilardii]
MAGDITSLVSSNLADVNHLADMLKGTELLLAAERFNQAEVQLGAAKTAVSLAKKKLARLMHSQQLPQNGTQIDW